MKQTNNSTEKGKLQQQNVGWQHDEDGNLCKVVEIEDRLSPTQRREAIFAEMDKMAKELMEVQGDDEHGDA